VGVDGVNDGANDGVRSSGDICFVPITAYYCSIFLSTFDVVSNKKWNKSTFKGAIKEINIKPVH